LLDPRGCAVLAEALLVFHGLGLVEGLSVLLVLGHVLDPEHQASLVLVVNFKVLVCLFNTYQG